MGGRELSEEAHVPQDPQVDLVLALQAVLFQMVDKLESMERQIADLHAAYAYVKENGPALVAQFEKNPMLKMLGIKGLGG